MSEPTPRPWKWWTSNSWRRLTGADGKDGDVLSPTVNRFDGHPDLVISEADAAHIVKCVNCHDELVAALEELVDFMSDGEKNLAGDLDLIDGRQHKALLRRVKEARAALKLAKGES